ncbi:MAG: hypothetical protein AABY13_02970, partial [Nanoarchaeota archaeon]
MSKAQLRDSHVVLILVALFLVALITFIMNQGNEQTLVVAGDIFYVFYAAIAGIAGIVTVKKYGHKTPLTKTLLLVTIMVCLDAIAGTIWAIYEVGLG